MMHAAKLTGLARTCAILLAITLTGIILSQAERILVPLVLAVLFAFILTPLVTGLQRLGLRRAPAALVVVLMAMVGVAAVGYVVSRQLQALAVEIPQYKDIIRDKVASVTGVGGGAIEDLMSMVREIKEDVAQEMETAADRREVKPVAVVVSNDQSSGFIYSFSSIAGPLLEGLATAVLIVVMVLFLLIMREDIRARMLRLVGPGRLTQTTKALDDGGRRMSRYLFMQFTINSIFGVLIALGLYLMGLPYAMLWGFLAALLRFIPYLGTWIALALPFAHSVAIFPGWWQPLAIAGYFIVLDLLAAYLVEPVLFGHSIGVSPFALLVATAFWTWLWGPVGLLLATPLTSCLVVLGKYVPQLQALDILLGNEQALESRVSFYQRLLVRDIDEATDLVETFLHEHTLEEALDEVFLPALIYLRKDLAEGTVSSQDHQFILHTLRDMVDDLPVDNTIAAPETMERVIVFGCPVRDDIDETAVHFLRKLFEQAPIHFELLSSRMLSAEVVARVREDPQAIVCLASLPPGGMAQTRYLCKRLRSEMPHLKIVVGEWANEAFGPVEGPRLLAAGADQVTYSIRETKVQILALMPVVAEQRRRNDHEQAVALSH